MVHYRGGGDMNLDEAYRYFTWLCNFFGVPPIKRSRFSAIEDASLLDGEILFSDRLRVRFKVPVSHSTVFHEFMHYILYLSRLEYQNGSVAENDADDIEHRLVYRIEAGAAKHFWKIYKSRKRGKRRGER